MSHRARVLATLLCLAAVLLLLGCVRIEREVQVTPEVIPQSIEGARWQALPVPYCVVRDDAGYVDHEEFVEAIAEAFQRWGVPTRSDGDCAGPLVSGDGVNQIGWGEPPDRGEGVFEAGYTRLLFVGCRPGECEGGASSRIIEADITIDADPPARFESRQCLFSIVLHETGHFLGVPHLPSPALMAPVAAGCPQELTDVDRQAIDELY